MNIQSLRVALAKGQLGLLTEKIKIEIGNLAKQSELEKNTNEQFIALMQSRSAAEWAQDYCAFVKKEDLSTTGVSFEKRFFNLFVRTLGFEGNLYPKVLGSLTEKIKIEIDNLAKQSELEKYTHILSRASSDLSQQLIDYCQKNDRMSGQVEAGLNSFTVDRFWRSLGKTSIYSAPLEVDEKMREVQMLAEEQMEQMQQEALINKEQELQALSIEAMVEELVEIMRVQGIPAEEYHTVKHIDSYWESKGFPSYYHSSSLINRKKTQVIDALQKYLQDKRAQEEQALLPVLAEECMQWAVEGKLKRVTHKDLQLFLIGKAIDFYPSTYRMLYLMVCDKSVVAPTKTSSTT